jgi:hypothetical protein
MRVCIKLLSFGGSGRCPLRRGRQADMALQLGDLQLLVRDQRAVLRGLRAGNCKLRRNLQCLRPLGPSACFRAATSSRIARRSASRLRRHDRRDKPRRGDLLPSRPSRQALRQFSCSCRDIPYRVLESAGTAPFFFASTAAPLLRRCIPHFQGHKPLAQLWCEDRLNSPAA